MPVGTITDEWFFISGVDVLASTETGGVVALGDSLTDANIRPMTPITAGPTSWPGG